MKLFSNGENKPATATLNLQRIYRYFLSITCIPIRFSSAYHSLNSSTKSESWPMTNSRLQILLYACMRLLPFLNTAHYTVLIVKGLFQSTSTKSDANNNNEEEEDENISVMEALLWVTAWSFIFLLDHIMLSSKFSLSFYRLIEFMEQVWAKLGDAGVSLEKIKRANDRKVRRIFVYSSINDFLTIYTYEWTTAVSLHFIFSAIPWGAAVTDFTYSTFLRLTYISLDVGWGALLIFPGIVAQHIANVIMGMEQGLRTRNLRGVTRRSNFEGHGYSSTEEILKDYAILEYAVRELRENRFSKALLLLYMVIGIQQTFQCYVAFKTINADMSNYFFILDLYLTGSRVLCGFSSLSRVTHASESFVREAKRSLMSPTPRIAKGRHNMGVGPPSESECRKLALVKNLRTVKMKIGPCNCNGNLPLAAMANYLNYIVVAALWP